MPVTLHCKTCQRFFTPSKSLKGSYCSRACYDKMAANMPVMPCPWCGAEFKARIVKGVRQRYCSTTCSAKHHSQEREDKRDRAGSLAIFLGRPLGVDRSRIRPLPVYGLTNKKGVEVCYYSERRLAEARGEKFLIVPYDARVVTCCACKGLALPKECEAGYLDWRTDEQGRICCYTCETRAM